MKHEHEVVVVLERLNLHAWHRLHVILRLLIVEARNLVLHEAGEFHVEARIALADAFDHALQIILIQLRALRVRVSAHSHTRSTRQPALRRVRVTSRSRCAFRASFASHHAARVAGFVACRGQPCQKHPSTKTASVAARKTKLGFPKTRALRRQQVIPCLRLRAMSRSSVARLSSEQMRDITSLRFAFVKTSATGYTSTVSTVS